MILVIWRKSQPALEKIISHTLKCITSSYTQAIETHRHEVKFHLKKVDMRKFIFIPTEGMATDMLAKSLNHIKVEKYHYFLLDDKT